LVKTMILNLSNLYKDYFDNMLIDRIEENNNFFEKLGQDDDFKKVVMDKLLPLVFERIRKDSK